MEKYDYIAPSLLYIIQRFWYGPQNFSGLTLLSISEDFYLFPGYQTVEHAGVPMHGHTNPSTISTTTTIPVPNEEATLAVTICRCAWAFLRDWSESPAQNC